MINRLYGESGPTAVLFGAAGCGLMLLLPIVGGLIALRSLRGIADPLAQVMAAADAVAEGDLSVRVTEVGRGEFRQLAVSFNRMVAELQRADQQRRNLTADVVHELRTPIHVLQGNLEGLLDGVYQPTTEHINLLLDETHHLTRLVEDLRTLTLAEDGQLPLESAPLDTADLLNDATTSFSGQAEAAGIELWVEVEQDDKPLYFLGDAWRMDQVLGNLIVNALQHTPTGGSITLRAKHAGEWICIQVVDTGSGIPPEDQPFIFDRFWRGDRSRSRSGGNSGLGLAIARQLIESQGGRIRVESQPRRGATFSIEMPVSSLS